MVIRPPRRGRFRVRLELGLAAFAPALGLFGFRLRDSAWAWLFLVPALFGATILLLHMVVARRGNPEPFVFEVIEDKSSEVLGHIGAYLLPVLLRSSASNEQLVMGALALALIMYIHIATGKVYVNPMLYLFGSRIYSATSSGATFYLIAKSEVADWEDSQRCIRMASTLLIEAGRKED